MLSTDSVVGAGPSALTTRAFARKHAALARALHAAGYRLRAVRNWDALLEVPAPAPDVILVDYDEIGHTSDGVAAPVSAHRLVTLLARQLATQPTALIVMSNLDFAEVEDLAHAGVHALLSPHQPTSVCLDDIRAAVKRRHARRRYAHQMGCSIVPVLTPDSTDAVLAVVYTSMTPPVAHA
jgi:hypothetical protein